MTSNRLPLLLAAALLLPLGCDKPKPTKKGPGADAEAQADAQEAKDEPGPTAQTDKSGASDPMPDDPLELTKEELELMAADPATLSPEQNRKRAHAFRKKVMQNPDSEAAKALEDARAAVLAGEVDPLPGKTPGEDKGLVIELPEHLRNQDQTYGVPKLPGEEADEAPSKE